MAHFVCIYHGNCADGFGAAWAVWRSAENHNMMHETQFVAGHYGQEPPDVTGKTVIMVDFSYKRDVMLEIADNADRVVVIDHHDTAEKELVDLPDNVEVHFDQAKSGAVLAWEHFNSHSTVPYLLKLVQDRDLWRFELPETKEVSAALFSHEWTFDNWCEFACNWQKLRAEGAALLRKQQKDVKALCEPHNVKHVALMHEGKEITVPAVNCPWMYASDVGHELCKQYPDAPLSVTYMYQKDLVKFSLRSDNKVHCGTIAAVRGGGGHPNAAGFQLETSQACELLKDAE